MTYYPGSPVKITHFPAEAGSERRDVQHQELRRDDDGGGGAGGSPPELQAAVAPEAAAARALLRLAHGPQGKGVALEVRLNENIIVSIR